MIESNRMNVKHWVLNAKHWVLSVNSVYDEPFTLTVASKNLILYCSFPWPRYVNIQRPVLNFRTDVNVYIMIEVVSSDDKIAVVCEDVSSNLIVARLLPLK